jgi:NADPH-dependent glutamate synthase beta subunit-like oxidoreductase
VEVEGYTALVLESEFSEAVQLIRKTLPFPGIMGCICTHLCESRYKREEVDRSIRIAASKRAAAD